MKYLPLALLLLVGCGGKSNEEYIDFIFKIPFQMTVRDTVSVGDTLWLTANFSAQLTDFKSGERYLIKPEDIDLKTIIGIFELKFLDRYLSQQPSATTNFKFVNMIGSIVSKETTFSQVLYYYNQESYRFKVGIIAQKKGVFSINFLDGWSVGSEKNNKPDISYLLPKYVTDEKKIIGFLDGFYYYINDGSNNHNIFKDNCLSTIPNNPSIGNVNSEQEGTFTFVVK